MNDVDVNRPLGSVPVKVGGTVPDDDLSDSDVALRHQTLEATSNVVLVRETRWIHPPSFSANSAHMVLRPIVLRHAYNRAGRPRHPADGRLRRQRVRPP